MNLSLSLLMSIGLFCLADSIDGHPGVLSPTRKAVGGSAGMTWDISSDNI